MIHEWKCLDCGLDGKFETDGDVWSLISSLNKTHETESPDCDIKRARIFPLKQANTNKEFTKET